MSVAANSNMTSPMNHTAIQMVPLTAGKRLYKPLTQQPVKQQEASLSMEMVEFVPAIINVSERIEESDTIESKLVQQLQQLFVSENESQAPVSANETDKAVARQTSGWGTFRAPLRDYERLMMRVRLASGAVTRAALVNFTGSIPEQSENPVQTREKILAQLLLDYFEVIRSAGRSGNEAVIEWSDVLAVAEQADDLMGQKAGNPYILGLSDVEFERVKAAQAC